MRVNGEYAKYLIGLYNYIGQRRSVDGNIERASASLWLGNIVSLKAVLRMNKGFSLIFHPLISLLS